jgi:hypothetical protein
MAGNADVSADVDLGADVDVGLHVGVDADVMLCLNFKWKSRRRRCFPE